MLEQCLEGFKRQKLDPSKFEIIIVDDGSKSRSDELVRRYGNEMPVHYIYQQNAGLAAARNTGIEAAKGNVIVPFDDDNCPHPDCLTRHYGFHLANPSVEDAMLAFMEWTPGLEITPLMHYVTELDPRLWCYKNIQQGQLLPFGFLWGGCSSYKKELIQKAGGFNPDFRFGYEDTEAEFRMRQRGLRVHFDRYAINYVSKPVDYEEFCNRCYKQGKSLWRLKQLYPGSQPIREYTSIGNPRDAISNYRNIAGSVDLIKKMLSTGWSLPPTGAGSPSLDLLYRCLYASFEYWKNKGILDGMQAQGSLCADRSKSILVIAPELPAYDRASGSFRLFQIIKLLRESGHRVTFISRAPGAWANPASYIAKLEELGVHVFPADPKKIFEKWGVKPDIPDIHLETILREGSFDVAYLYFYELAGQYIAEIRAHSPRTHIVVDSVDLHFLRDQRGAALFPNPEMLNRLGETKAAELAVYRKADTVITVTGADREVLLRESPGLSIEVVPNIHPIPKQKPASFHSRQDFLFIGSFLHHPNFDAMQFFCSEAWPLISSKLPQARLYIVGDSPHSQLRALANDRIIVTGYVPDTAPYLQRCRVSIAPLRYGAGMKGKVGEALASGLPVVATPTAVEGTGLRSGRNVIVADRAPDFADAALSLYKDEELWNRLSANGREFVTGNYSPEAVAARLEDALFGRASTLEPHSPAAPCRGVTAAGSPNKDDNILIIDPFLPWFDRASGSLRLFSIINLLRQQGHHVTFIARDGRGQEPYRRVLETMGVEVYDTDPVMLARMGVRVEANPIDMKRLLSSRHYAVAFLSFYSIAGQYLPIISSLSPDTKILIDTVDIHFVREAREAQLSKDPEALKRAAATKQAELAIYSRADALITVTEQDWLHIQSYLPEKPHFVIPNIHHVPDNPVSITRSGLIFVGNFNHGPNPDAVRYFLGEIFPLVKNALPEITLRVVGNNPPDDIKALGNDDVIVTGYVPSVEPYLQKARVSVAPLRYGAGMKGKIGEAMANGLPVVTTSVGAEGIGLVHGETALIADTPAEFAEHIVRLCSDDSLWNTMAQNARSFIRDNFSPRLVSTMLHDMMDALSTMEQKGSSGEDHRVIPVTRPRVLDEVAASILILTRNQLHYTVQCLKSIQRYTDLPHEIIIVDNNSTDDTPAFLRQFSVDNPNMKVIFNNRNRGFAAGNNQGLTLASGKYLVLLNNDTVVTSGWLEHMIEVLRRFPRASMVGPMSNFVSGPQLVPEVSYRDADELEYFARQRAGQYAGQTQAVSRLIAFCMVMRRQVVEKIGGLDESFGLGNFEDDDFCVRAWLSGFEAIIAQDVYIHHTGSVTLKQEGLLHSTPFLRNWERFKAKWAIPAHTTIETGYELGEQMRKAAPIYIPLPDISIDHTVDSSGRYWHEIRQSVSCSGGF
jgi:GT2 family glycosyltransferase/glycosyltransferase involved in cell wall biosynthesis